MAIRICIEELIKSGKSSKIINILDIQSAMRPLGSAKINANLKDEVRTITQDH